MAAPAVFRHVRAATRDARPREVVAEVLRDFGRHDVLTFASAISFQVFFAIVPLALFGLALMAGLGLEAQWTQEWAPRVRDAVSAAMFAVIDQTVQQVVDRRHVFWMTAGAVIATWEISGATRAIMDVFDRIYGSDSERGFWRRLRESIALGLAVAALLLAAAAAVILGDVALGRLSVESPLLVWLRWPVAVGLLLAVVALLVALAPAERHPLRWISFGSVLVVVAWLATSLVFSWYLTSIADYGSIFGALATVIILLTYLYAASVAFLTGAVVDAIVRRRVEGHPSGREGG